MLYMFMVTLVSLTHTSHFKWIIYAARWSFLGIFHPAQSPFWHREHPYVVPTLIWVCTDFPRATVHWLGGFPVVHSCKLPSAHVGVLYISECTSSLSVACTWDNSLKQVLKDTLCLRCEQGPCLLPSQRALHLFTCPETLCQDSRPKEGRRLQGETNFLKQQEGFGK